MGKKRLFINLFANILSFGVNIGIVFLLTPYLVKTLGKEAYGFFPLAINFLSYAGIITVALDAMASRFITIHLEKKNVEKVNVYFNSVLFGNLFISLAMLIISVFILYFLKYIFEVPASLIHDVKLLFAFTFLTLIITVSTSVFTIATFAINRLDLSSIRTIVGNLLKVVFLVGVFYFFRPKLYFLGAASLLVSVYLAVTNFNLTKRYLPEVSIGSKYFQFKVIKELMSSGIWNSVNQLSIVLLTQLDLLIANIFLGSLAMGEFSLVKILPNFLQSVAGLLVGVFLPQFTMLYARGHMRKLLYEINFSIKLVSLLMTIPIGFILVYGDSFFKLWVPGEDSQKLFVLSGLTILPMVVTSSINPVYNVYTITNKLKVPALVWLVAGTFNTFAVILLLRFTTIGIYSIPIVGLVTGLIRNLAFTPLYAAKCLGQKFDVFYKAIIKGSLCVIITVAISAIPKYIVGFEPLSWPSFFLLAFGIFSLSFIINLFVEFGKKDIFNILHLASNKIFKHV